MLTVSDGDFSRIVDFVRENYGINLKKKRSLIQSRLALDVERRGYTSFGHYLDDIFAHPNSPECQHMIDRLSTNHTFFFREPSSLEHLRDVAVPALIARGVKHILIWCAAAASGQECYSIAMMMEAALYLRKDVSYHILASDINTDVLKVGERGVYPLAEMENIPSVFRRLYCKPLDDSSFEIAPELKDNISWQKINLVKPLDAVPQQHVIFCRNVMIYFEPDTKDALASELHRLLLDGGYVYVGNTETLDKSRTRFDYICPAVFEKKER